MINTPKQQPLQTKRVVGQNDQVYKHMNEDYPHRFTEDQHQLNPTEKNEKKKKTVASEPYIDHYEPEQKEPMRVAHPR